MDRRWKNRGSKSVGSGQYVWLSNSVKWSNVYDPGHLLPQDLRRVGNVGHFGSVKGTVFIGAPLPKPSHPLSDSGCHIPLDDSMGPFLRSSHGEVGRPRRLFQRRLLLLSFPTTTLPLGTFSWTIELVSGCWIGSMRVGILFISSMLRCRISLFRRNGDGWLARGGRFSVGYLWESSIGRKMSWSKSRLSSRDFLVHGGLESGD